MKNCTEQTPSSLEHYLVAYIFAALLIALHQRLLVFAILELLVILTLFLHFSGLCLLICVICIFCMLMLFDLLTTKLKERLNYLLTYLL